MTGFMTAAPGGEGRRLDEEEAEEKLRSCLPLQPATSLVEWLLLPVQLPELPQPEPPQPESPQLEPPTARTPTTEQLTLCHLIRSCKNALVAQGQSRIPGRPVNLPDHPGNHFTI